MRQIIRTLGSLEVATITLLYLFVLVFLGTVYQVELSIQEATARFFHSWVLDIAPIPLPGGQFVFALLGINVVIGTVTRIPFRWYNAGLFLVHIGLILIFAGTLVSRFVTRESVLALPEGARDSYSYDLRNWDLVVTGNEDDRFPLTDVPATIREHPVRVSRYLRDADVIGLGPLNVESVSGYRSIVRAEQPRDNPVPGVILEIRDRTVLLHGGDSRAFPVAENLHLRLLPRRYELPAEIELVEFHADFYEGTQTPRWFSSDVKIITGDVERAATISMNNPLRLGDFTFYQLGYDSREGFREVSLFHVVRNRYRLYPYVVGLIVSAGLVIHAVLYPGGRNRGALS